MSASREILNWLVGARARNAPCSKHLAIGRRTRVPRGLLCGSFHPLHAAHRGMADRAAKWLDGDVDFELAILNADKPPLDDAALESRLAQDFGTRQLWLSNTPHFDAKAALFPGTTFIVGVDTMARIGDLRFYRAAPEVRAAAIQAIAAAGCRFLVFARIIQNTVHQWDQLDLPPELKRLCQAVPPQEFLSSLSSSSLRPKMD